MKRVGELVVFQEENIFFEFEKKYNDFYFCMLYNMLCICIQLLCSCNFVILNVYIKYYEYYTEVIYYVYLFFVS